MRKVFAAAALAATVSIATLAFAQTKPYDRTDQDMPRPQLALAQSAPPVEDARSLASDADVGDARRSYRAACDAYQSTAYCECVTAGVAQALVPQEVRIAARTIGERINAEGDAAFTPESDNTSSAESSAERIEQVEGHYAAACWSYRD